MQSNYLQEEEIAVLTKIKGFKKRLKKKEKLRKGIRVSNLAQLEGNKQSCIYIMREI